jgi:hypothetical protein
LGFKTTSFWPFYHYFFLKKKKRKKKKENIKKKKKKGGERNWGWLQPPPWPKMGWPATPFLAEGWLEPPPPPVWGWSNHPHGQGGGPATPMAKGVVRPPPKAQKKKKKKKTKNGFWPFGGGRTTPKDLGVDLATPKGRFGVDESTPRSLGVVRTTPKRPKPIFRFFFFFFFFFFWAFGGSRTTPLAMGVFDHPQTGRGGGSSHPRFLSPPFFYNIFLFLFFSFLKKKNDKMVKTTSF